MCRVTASTSAGSQSKSGNPCDRLIAPRSAASFDMTVKIVVPTLGSFDVRPIGCTRVPSSMLPECLRRLSRIAGDQEVRRCRRIREQEVYLEENKRAPFLLL